MEAEKLVKIGKELAADSMAELGEIPAGVFLFDNELGNLLIPYRKGHEDEDESRLLIIAAIVTSRKRGSFDGAILVSEAWVSKKTNMLPSKDPERAEVVLLSAYGSDGSRLLETRAIKRKGKKVGVGEVLMRELGAGGDSWMDVAFNDGPSRMMS